MKDEAPFALKRDKLVPVVIEEVAVPFRFEGLHTLSLLDWEGSKDFSEFRRLVEDICTILGRSPTGTVVAEEQRRLEAEAERKAEKERKVEEENPRRREEEQAHHKSLCEQNAREIRPESRFALKNRRLLYAGGVAVIVFLIAAANEITGAKKRQAVCRGW